jgi:hypothetical protein
LKPVGWGCDCVDEQSTYPCTYCEISCSDATKCEGPYSGRLLGQREGRGDAIEDATRIWLVAYAKSREGLSGAHLGAGLCVDEDAYRVIHGLIGARASGAHSDGGEADRMRIDG